MRTVTFSDPEVVRTMNESFVCAWINKRPSEKFKDGQRRMKGMNLRNGTAASNVTSVFAMPDGHVIHAMAGSLDVPFFETQIAFAKEVRHRMYEDGKLRPHGEASYVATHQVARQVKDPLVSRVHTILAARLRKVQEMPLDLFDPLQEKDRRCVPPNLKPKLCGFAAVR